MRIRPTLRILPALIGMLLLALVPAAQAAETLLLSCSICTQIVATGKGLPANQTVYLNLVDVKTGKQIGSRHTVTTDSQGLFVAKIPVDLSVHSSVESTVWKTDGSLLVVAAHNRFEAPCKNGKMTEMGDMSGHMGMGEGEMGHTLAFTGSNAPLLLGLGASLLVLGAGLALAGRRRHSH
jgi:hypothetical protein